MQDLCEFLYSVFSITSTIGEGELVFHIRGALYAKKIGDIAVNFFGFLFLFFFGGFWYVYNYFYQCCSNCKIAFKFYVMDFLKSTGLTSSVNLIALIVSASTCFPMFQLCDEWSCDKGLMDNATFFLKKLCIFQFQLWDPQSMGCHRACSSDTMQGSFPCILWVVYSFSHHRLATWC